MSATRDLDELTRLVKEETPRLTVTGVDGTFTACVVAQKLVLAGRDDVRLYPGSFSEWCRREGYPIEAGPARRDERSAEFTDQGEPQP